MTTAGNPMLRTLSEDEIRFAYEICLGRPPSERDVERMLENSVQLTRLRRIFFASPEFQTSLKGLLPNFEVSIERRNPPEQAQRYVHLHIPKTAGTTMSAILATAFGHDKSITVSENVQGPLGGQDPANLMHYRFIYGHMSYKAMEAFPEDTVAICMLRHPGERLLSFHGYVQRTEDHPLHEAVAKRHLSFGEFLEFLDNDKRFRRTCNNAQMRVISGLTDDVYFGQERQVFETALHHILTGRVIFGLTERLATFQAYLMSLGILKRISAARLNVSEAPAILDQELDRMTVSQREVFERCVRWDDMLYAICDRIAQDREARFANTTP